MLRVTYCATKNGCIFNLRSNMVAKILIEIKGDYIKMVKNDMLKIVAEKAEVSQKQADAVLSAYVEVVAETLAKDTKGKVALGNLGSFKVKEVPARDGVSAINGQPWHTDAHNEITFKMSKTAKML